MRVIVYISVVILLIGISLFKFKFNSNNLTAETTSDLYGNIAPENYLRGKFNPAQHNLFVNLDDTGIPVNRKNHYLRKECVLALKKMLKAFAKENPHVQITIISSTRNFYHQKSIWDGKWNGKRLTNGEKLNITTPDPLKRALKILRFSSMPGTSRHHWGTDFDINSLSNNYFAQGKGKVIYNWLNKNAKDYGFYQPYTANRKRGYEEERWHWSYLPLAKHYYHDWIKLFEKDLSKIFRKGEFAGSEIAGKLAPIYVKGINPACR